jgi:hypothetical protein
LLTQLGRELLSEANSLSQNSQNSTSLEYQPTSQGIQLSIEGEGAKVCSLAVSVECSEAVVKRVRRVFELWQRECHPRAWLTTERELAVIRRIDEGRSDEEFAEAIAGAKRAAYVNDKGVCFDDLELICRNGTKFDSFRRRAQGVESRDELVIIRKRRAAAFDRLLGERDVA